MKTTYVLGAGASCDMGYPFAKSMGGGLFAWRAQHMTSGPYDFRSAAESLRATFEQVDDIEDLLARIDEYVSEAKGPTWERRCVAFQLANHDKPALVEAIRGWFEEVRQGPSESYGLFGRHIIQPGDCVISFNYDVSLDRELRLAGVWNLGDGYGFAIEGFENRSPVKLLKLHGSINWLASMFGGVTHGPTALGSAGVFGRRPVFANSELMFLGYSNVRDSLFPRGGTPVLRPLILPTRCKKFYFDKTWAANGRNSGTSYGIPEHRSCERVTASQSAGIVSRWLMRERVSCYLEPSLTRDMLTYAVVTIPARLLNGLRLAVGMLKRLIRSSLENG